MGKGVGEGGEGMGTYRKGKGGRGRYVSSLDARRLQVSFWEEVGEKGGSWVKGAGGIVSGGEEGTRSWGMLNEGNEEICVGGGGVGKDRLRGERVRGAEIPEGT